jgi:GNAT superfamily N-acetyltransferase
MGTPPPDLDVGPVRNSSELQQIINLQRQNLATSLTPQDAARDGFVTVVHTLDLLEQMHALAPSIVARSGGAVVGYALTMPTACRRLIPILEPMFGVFDSLAYAGRPLGSYRFYVMGQVCVAASHRGRGVFDALYEMHRQTYGPSQDLLITEISVRNHRSLRAHERVGFQPIHRYADETDQWVVVAWDWRASA